MLLIVWQALVLTFLFGSINALCILWPEVFMFHILLQKLCIRHD